MLICRHLPALGESLATLVGAMPVAFLEPHLNGHNPLSVFNTKTPRERASERPPDPPFHFHHDPMNLQSPDVAVYSSYFGALRVIQFCVFHFLVLSMPDTVEEMCPELPLLDKLLQDVSDVSESGARYNDMPEVRKADGVVEFSQTAVFFRGLT